MFPNKMPNMHMQEVIPKTIVPASQSNLLSRLWQYQHERFPLAQHGLLIAVFSSASVSLSAILRNSHEIPSLLTFAVAFVSSLLLFLQLRIADEFKDFHEDKLYRPYRPVPRGLVSLDELHDVFFVSCAMQALLAVLLQPALIAILLAIWLYLAAMTKEFYLGRCLRKHPVAYMVSHMAILPLIDYYVTACEWLTHQCDPPGGLVWFLVVSFFNGMVIEIGRKLRAPGEEEIGVETYSALWGLPRATIIWIGIMLAAASFAVVTAKQFGLDKLLLTILSVVLALSCLRVAQLVKIRCIGMAAKFEVLAGLWTISMYTSLGILPLILKHWRLS